MRYAIKVITGASRDEVQRLPVGAFDYKIKVTVVAEKGKANKRVCELLAKFLQVPISAITIISGHSSAHKIIEVMA